MKAAIEVSSRKEAEAIKNGLGDPTVRAFVQIIGVLNALDSDRARGRVLSFVSDVLEEQLGKVTAVSEGQPNSDRVRSTQGAA